MFMHVRNLVIDFYANPSHRLRRAASDERIIGRKGACIRASVERNNLSQLARINPAFVRNTNHIACYGTTCLRQSCAAYLGSAHHAHPDIESANTSADSSTVHDCTIFRLVQSNRHDPPRTICVVW